MGNAITQAIDFARNGKISEARQLAEINLGDHPDDAETWHLLGLLDNLTGSHDTAIKRFQRAIELNPNIAKYYSNLGNALYMSNCEKEAEQAYQHASKLEPLNQASAFNLSLMLHKQARFSEALSLLSPFDGSGDPSGETDLLLGMLYRDTNQAEMALTHFKRSVALNPGNAEAWALTADMQQQLHQVDEARDSVKQGLARSSDLPALRLVEARLLRREKEFTEAVCAIGNIQLDGLPDDLAANLLNEWGTNLDRLDRPAEAMAKFRAAKKRQALSLPDISKAAADYLDFIEDALTLDYSALASQPIPEEEPAPVFLIGFPRSGTTLLDQILDSHPAIQTLEEKPVVTGLIDAHPDLFQAVDNRINPLPSSVRQKLQQLYFEQLSQYLDWSPGQVLVDKLPLHITNVHHILQIFPCARFILALRHPCDVVLSCQMHLFKQNAAMAHFQSLEGTARLYIKVMQLWQTFRQKLQPSYHEIRYENLVSRFDEEIGGLLAFLNLPWDENVRQYNEHASKRGRINTPSYHQVVEPLYTRARGRWARYAHELESVLPLLEPAIRQLGYDFPLD